MFTQFSLLEHNFFTLLHILVSFLTYLMSIVLRVGGDIHHKSEIPTVFRLAWRQEMATLGQTMSAVPGGTPGLNDQKVPAGSGPVHIENHYSYYPSTYNITKCNRPTLFYCPVLHWDNNPTNICGGNSRWFIKLRLQFAEFWLLSWWMYTSWLHFLWE